VRGFLGLGASRDELCHPGSGFAARGAFGVEAEAASRRILNAIVRQVGGRPIAVRPAANALPRGRRVVVAAAGQPSGRGPRSRHPGRIHPRQARRLIEPIVRATLDNFFLRGPGKSFSGPIAGGRADN